MEYQELDALVSELESAVEETTPQKGYWKELWDLVRRIGAAFKEARYPDKSQKDEAWRLFQSLVERAKARSVREKERIRERERGFEERKRLSQEARSSIESMAASATPSSEFERGLLAIITFPVTLALDFVETTLGVKWGSELDERQDELRACSQQLKRAWRTLSDSKDVMLPGDKAQAYRALTAAQERLNDAWDRLREAKRELHEARQRAWEEKKREREERRRERETRHEEFVARVRANIEKLEDKLERARNALSRNEAHLDKLRSYYDTAWSDKFRDLCSGWIDECEDKTASIREHIERLEGWIEEERRKLY